MKQCCFFQQESLKSFSYFEHAFIFVYILLSIVLPCALYTLYLAINILFVGHIDFGLRQKIFEITTCKCFFWQTVRQKTLLMLGDTPTSRCLLSVQKNMEESYIVNFFSLSFFFFLKKKVHACVCRLEFSQSKQQLFPHTSLLCKFLSS